MSDLKTKPSNESVDTFILAIEDPQKREDAFKLREIMAEITGAPAKMWGSSIIGFGEYTYTYDSGRTGDWFYVGFSPRKTAFSVYLMGNLDALQNQLSLLGKYKTGKSCLYIKKLNDVDERVLREMITLSVQSLQEKYNRTK